MITILHIMTAKLLWNVQNWDLAGFFRNWFSCCITIVSQGQMSGTCPVQVLNHYVTKKMILATKLNLELEELSAFYNEVKL